MLRAGHLPYLFRRISAPSDTACWAWRGRHLATADGDVAVGAFDRDLLYIRNLLTAEADATPYDPVLLAAACGVAACINPDHARPHHARIAS